MRKLCISLLILVAVPCLTLAQATATATNPPAAASPAVGVEEFNRAFFDATLHMDDAATLALWEEDGVSLLPSTKPIMGKKAIAKFFADVMVSLKDAKMDTFDGKCFDILVSGDWASEWCTEHQVVSIPGRPKFDGWGKMALILHHDADGKWRLKQEMWNQALGE